MKTLIKSVTQGKKVLLLGYGREGKSSLQFIRENCIGLSLTVADSNPLIADKNPELKQEGIDVISGPDYLHQISNFDLIIKSPGVSLKDLNPKIDPDKISSQTDLFLRAYSKQIAGVTGTKGKSTTASLLYHIIKTHTSDTLLAGNIGVPLFDLIPNITPETRIVCELSSHQLEYITKGPHIGILLNLYQEHLDHYSSFYDYQMAKLQIGLKQSENDYFLWTAFDANTMELLSRNKLISRNLPVFNEAFKGDGIGVSGSNIVLKTDDEERVLIPVLPETKLKGTHNLINISVAAAAAALMDVPLKAIVSGVSSFNPLEHRIEFVGTFNKKRFFNDSISTIPEATIAALKTIKQVDTLILGGFDRGIDYSILIECLTTFTDKKIVFTGPAGSRIFDEFIRGGGNPENAIFENDFSKAVFAAITLTPENGTCLLSPAASSYDSFKNFEERGKCFKKLVGA
ncbi:MAG: UDP-N-acetylmuramoyl-L-alanine--D-glutamate ligase [Lentimicrobium sp.]|nr:UDP-N-acetylmuramoyl-L-alanine--D-glutamate ligase [Lentimicrobium sp.]